MSGSAPATATGVTGAAGVTGAGAVAGKAAATPSLFDYFPKPSSTLSDADIAAGAPLRDSARKVVLDEQTYSNKLVPVLTQAGVASTIITSYTTFLTTEIAWWNTNVELSTRQVAARKTQFEEQLQTYHITLNQATATAISKLPVVDATAIVKDYPDKSFIPNLQAVLNKKKSDANAAAAAKNKAILNRSAWDNISEASQAALKWAGIILYVCLALRCGAFVANDLLYKPLPYRILAFVYVFLLLPFVAPYYVWREIKYIIWPALFERPIFNSIFPMYPYNPDDSMLQMTMGLRFFGYPDTMETRTWIDTKKKEAIAAQLKALEPPKA